MIGIIDYGAGNTQSIINALNRLDVPYFLSESSAQLATADKLILPGVGHAKAAMNQLKKHNLVDFIKSWERPLLGVCLGMQLLCSFSEEGNTKCLGIVEEEIVKFSDMSLKVPKMGWNTTIPSSDTLLHNIKESDYFYFVHSYYLPVSKYSICDANYGIDYTVAIRKNNFYGVQFHPEKSSSSGALVLLNFINL
jgi:glutamine amidotransferase